MLTQGELKLLSEYSIDRQSFLLLKAGEKPVVRICLDEIGMNPEKLKELDRLCRAAGVKLHQVRMTEMFGSRLPRPLIVFYLSLSDSWAQGAYAADVAGDRVLLGRLLGYPECCINAFISNLARLSETDHIRLSLEKTKSAPLFYCNNIYNFDSRLSAGSAFETFALNYQIFNQTKDLFLIRHIPCSFDCGESLGIGKKTLELLKKENKAFARDVVNSLKRIVLYFDYFNWLVFDGVVSEDTLVYKRILPYKSIVSEDIVKRVALGNRLKCDAGTISVSRNGEHTQNIPNPFLKKGVIIKFD